MQIFTITQCLNNSDEKTKTKNVKAVFGGKQSKQNWNILNSMVSVQTHIGNSLHLTMRILKFLTEAIQVVNT